MLDKKKKKSYLVQLAVERDPNMHNLVEGDGF